VRVLHRGLVTSSKIAKAPPVEAEVTLMVVSIRGSATRSPAPSGMNRFVYCVMIVGLSIVSLCLLYVPLAVHRSIFPLCTCSETPCSTPAPIENTGFSHMDSPESVIGYHANTRRFTVL